MIHFGGEEIDALPGLQHPARRLSTGFVIQPVHWSDHPDYDEHWADVQSVEYGGRQSPGWCREMEMDLVRGGHPVWPMLTREVHVRDVPFEELCSDTWTLWRSVDHGVRVPTCCAWVGVNKDGDRYFYRQYYQSEATVSMNVSRILQRTENHEQIIGTVADPSIWQRKATDMKPLANDYAAAGMPIQPADNSRAGYDWLAAAFQSALARWSILRGHKPHGSLPQSLTPADLERFAKHPAIWFHPCCAEGEYNLFDQCRNLRWKEIAGDPLKKAPPEEFEDINDEGPDVVRYACQTAGVAWRRQPRGLVRGADAVMAALSKQERASGRFG